MKAKSPESFFPRETSDCHSFIQAVPQQFNIGWIFPDFEMLRLKTEEEESGSSSGQVFLYKVLAAGIVSKDVMSLCPGMMLPFVINRFLFFLLFVLCEAAKKRMYILTSYELSIKL